MNLSLILFLIGILGFVLNRKNIILMLISIEIMLLAITFLILVSSLSFDDILGQTYAIYIIAIAGAESAIGLGILVAFYRLTPQPSIHSSFSIKKVHYSLIKHNPLKYSIRHYSMQTGKAFILHPLFVSGFTDAEGSFVVTILKKAGYKTGWAIQARFQIKLHETDRALLVLIQKFFGNIGNISPVNTRSSVEFRVNILGDLLNVIIPHFEKYNLITNKHSDFVIFKEIVLLMTKNLHKDFMGLQLILNNRASLNWGLTDSLKVAFPLTIPVARLPVKDKLEMLSADWLTGFCTGESNFFIVISGGYAWLRFSVAQDVRDILLLALAPTYVLHMQYSRSRLGSKAENIVRHFNCGYVNKYNNRKVCEFVVEFLLKINDIILNIIPAKLPSTPLVGVRGAFFDKYPIQGDASR
jgi:NADH:ubiquinone oxidoreductase subunit K